MENDNSQQWAEITTQLRLVAESYVQRERPGHTLQATALVHEAYLRLFQQPDGSLRSPVDFARMAARTMRRILIDHARRRLADRRAGTIDRDTDPDALPTPLDGNLDRILDFDAKLSELERREPRLAHIVRLERYAGFDRSHIASLLSSSESTIGRERKAAMAWLRCALADDGDGAMREARA